MLHARVTSTDYVVIEGSGGSFLRCKSEIISLRGIDVISSSQKGSFRVLADVFCDIFSSLSTKPSVEESLAKLLDVSANSEKQHLHARNQIFEILQSEDTELDSPFWNQTLQPHQAQAVKAMVVDGLRGLCLFDEQGTGKTLTTIAAFDILAKKGIVESLFVVSPKTLIKTWHDEFKQFMNSQYSIVEVAGSPKQRQGALNSSGNVFLLSYETASTDFVTICGAMKHRRPLLVLDESFLVKNENANRSQGVELIRRDAVRSFVLCGTPAPNNAYDLIHQFNLSDQGLTFRGFRKTGDISVDSKEIEKRVETYGTFIRRTKDIVLPHLAEKVFEVIPCDLTQRQQELYLKAKEELVLFLKRLDNTTFKRELGSYFQKRAALTQIAVSPSLIGDPEIESGKYIKLRQLVGDLLTQDSSKKILIWSAFTKSSNHIEAQLKKWGIVRVDGTQSDPLYRQDAINRFQTDPNIRIFLGNPAAAGAGITLTAADTAIYVSLSNQAASYMQSLDRIHRIGQVADKVHYLLLVSSGTLDHVDVEKLSKKQSTQSWLLGDTTISGLDLSKALAELEGETPIVD